MKKQAFSLVLTAVMAVGVLTGCGSSEGATASKTDTPEESVSGSAAESTGNPSGAQFSFQDVSGLQFWFGSGAGAWRTVLTIQEDGSFAGEYSDGEMGSYTTYLCDFTGKLTQPEQVNKYTYSVQLESISYEREPGTEERTCVGGNSWTYAYTEP